LRREKHALVQQMPSAFAANLDDQIASLHRQLGKTERRTSLRASCIGGASIRGPQTLTMLVASWFDSSSSSDPATARSAWSRWRSYESTRRVSSTRCSQLERPWATCRAERCGRLGQEEARRRLDKTRRARGEQALGDRGSAHCAGAACSRLRLAGGERAIASRGRTCGSQSSNLRAG